MDNLIEAKKFLNQPVFRKLGQELARRYYSKAALDYLLDVSYLGMRVMRPYVNF